MVDKMTLNGVNIEKLTVFRKDTALNHPLFKTIKSRNKYTMHDVTRLCIESLFHPYGIIDLRTARFFIRIKAESLRAECSKAVLLDD